MAEARGLIRVVTPAEVNEAERQALPVAPAKPEEQFNSELARYIRQGFERARQHRTTNGVEQQLLSALRVYQGKYDPGTLSEIKAFGGSEVYSRITSVKCRGASALLRDIYFSGERPWVLEPTPEPKIPGNIAESVMALVQVEVESLKVAGQMPSQQMIQDRTQSLLAAAKKAEKRQAKKEADKATLALDDIMVEGNFYSALAEMIVDLPIFPYACVKGPIVRMSTELEWQPDGSKKIIDKPRMFWDRVSPFDLYFSPGASKSQKSTIYEHTRLMRSELYSLIGLPGYNETAIRDILASTPLQLKSWLSLFEKEREDLERRDDSLFSSEDLFVDCMEFNGFVDGKMLKDWGMTDDEVPDTERQYFATAWLIDRWVIKAQLSPNPRQRPNYYLTSFEKIPGSVTGNGLPEILGDVQDVANANLRALVNNMGIASGPQVVVDDTRVAPGQDSDSLYPWKRWHVISDPMNNAAQPVTFFQPETRAQELLGVYKEFNNMADEISAIPRFLTGSQRTGGAAATASGLAMLMNNASKVMQNVAANVDNDILAPAIESLYDMVMLSDPGVLRGDESIVVKGATLAIQREQDRVRQLEFLSITANPLDAELVGPKGRTSVLRSVARNLGLEYEDVVADDEEVQARIQQRQAMAAEAEATGAPQAPGPNASRNESGPPRLDTVSNMATT